MKNKLPLGLALTMLLVVCFVCVSCGSYADQEERADISVVTTAFPAYDFARQITGGEAQIIMLLPPGAEIHSFEPSPQDMIQIKDCDVFLWIGGQSETWVERVLSSMDTENMRILSMLDCVDLVEEEIVEGMQDDGKAEGIEYDEHVWTSPKNAARIVEQMRDLLAEVDPANADEYRSNAEAYLLRLTALDAALQAVVDSAARKTIVFADRFPFRYFAAAYGLTYYAAFPGCSTESEPSLKTLAFLYDMVRTEGIPVVFYMELSNERMADAICEDTGAKKRLLHSCHNVAKSDFEAGVTYLELMTNNVDALKEALW